MSLGPLLRRCPTPGDRAVNWPRLNRRSFLHRVYFVPRSFSGCLKPNELWEMRVRRICESPKHPSDRKLSFATVPLITFCVPYLHRVNGMPHSFVAEVDSR